MGSKRWLSTARAASYLGASVRTVRRYADDGRFAGVRCPGGRRILRLAELEQPRHEPACGGGGCGCGGVVYARVSSRRQRAGGDLDRQVWPVAAAAGDRLVRTFTGVACGVGDDRPV